VRRRFLEVCGDDIGALIERQGAFEHVRSIVLTGVELKGVHGTLTYPHWRMARRFEALAVLLRIAPVVSFAPSAIVELFLPNRRGLNGVPSSGYSHA
jgi:hypothetical protein